MTGGHATVTAEGLGDFLGLGTYRFAQLQKQDFDLELAYRVFHDLWKTGSTELFRLFTSQYVPTSISRDSIDDLVETLEVLILPHAREFAERRVSDVDAALSGLLRCSEHWYQYQNTYFDGWMKLSSDPLMVSAASAALRTIAAVECTDLPREVRDRVISRNNSPRTLLLSANTPLDLLLRSRPEQIDRIIDTIVDESEIDGERIAAILDTKAPALASGLL